MPYIKLDIAPILGYTATERAQAISKELLRISMPVAEQCASTYVFDWLTHPITGACVLLADSSHEIWVHPENDLTNLIALMPALPQQVKEGLEDLIKTSQIITFGQLLTGQETILTDEQMATDGWFTELEQT
jgi:hypothetical protein